MLAKIGSAIQLILALSIFYLGYTIQNVTVKVGEIVETYPQLSEDITSFSENLQIDEWLAAANTLEQLVPSTIESVDKITAAVGDTNKIAASIDAKLPAIMEEITQYRVSVIPSVLEETQQYRTDVLPKVLIESEGHRTQTVPLVVAESKALRAEIPPILAKADEIAEKSKEITQQATQGAVKGVIMSPIEIIRDAGSGLKERVTTTEEQ